MLKILNKKMNAQQFADYLMPLKFHFWDRKIDRIILHHTSSPISAWHNSGSMLHYWNLYQSRGWKSGPHIFVAPNGIWLFTPIKKQGRTSSPDADEGSVHIEIVGRYYDKAPTNQKIIDNLLSVIWSLFIKFDLGTDDIYHHNMFIGGENCSPKVTRKWIEAIIGKIKS